MKAIKDSLNRFVLLCVALIVAACGQPTEAPVKAPGSKFTATVIRVTDDYTLEIQEKNAPRRTLVDAILHPVALTRVRLSGLVCLPSAKRVIEASVFAKDITVHVHDIGNNGIIIGEVFTPIHFHPNDKPIVENLNESLLFNNICKKL